MGTHASITLKLRSRDRSRRLVSDSGEIINLKGCQYLRVYVHNDGYPHGLGKSLRDAAMTYEQALKFMLEGDRTTFETSYYAWRKESCPPVPVYDPSPSYEYNYYLEEIEEDDDEMPLAVFCVDSHDNDIDILRTKL